MNFSELNKLRKEDIDKLIIDKGKKLEKLRVEKRELEDFLKLKFPKGSESLVEENKGIGDWAKE